jgi:DNA-binding NarL/FixJ family response regulator
MLSRSASKARVTDAPGGGSPSIREVELGFLREVLDDLEAGQGGITSISGDPGMGKTWLLSAVGREAEKRGLIVLRAGCVEAERDVPYRAFIQAFGGWHRGAGNVSPPALAELMHRFAEGLGMGGRGLGGRYGNHCRYHADLRSLIVECLGESGRGVLLLLDNVHWVDPQSLELIETILDYPLNEPFSLVLEYRPRQSPVPLLSLVDHGRDLGVLRHLELGPLDLEQCTSLLGPGVPADRAQDLYQRSEGNPLYLAALAETDQDEPAWKRSFRSGVGMRLMAETASLADVEKTVLECAAVLGTRFDLGSIVEVAGVDRVEACRAVLALQQRDLVRKRADGTLAFRHPLLREFVYADVDTCMREAAHRKALQYFTRRGEPLPVLAGHVESLADDASPAEVRILAAAAREALNNADPVQAAHWLLGTLRPVRREEPGDAECSTWIPLIRALAQRGERDLIEQVRQALLATLTRAGSSVRACVAMYFATVQALLGGSREAQQMLTGEILLAEEQHAPSVVRLHAHRALVRLLSGQVLSRQELAELDERTRTEPENDEVRSTFLVVRGFSQVFSRESQVETTAPLAEAATTLDRLAGRGLPARPELLALMGWAEAGLDHHETAAAYLGQARDSAEEVADTHLLPLVLNGLAYTQYRQGRLLPARTTASESLGHLRRTLGGGQHALCLALISVVSAHTDPGSPTVEVAPVMVRDRSTNGAPNWWTPLLSMLLAEAVRVGGDPAQARRMITAGGAGFEWSDMPLALTARALETIAAAPVEGEPFDVWAEAAAAAADTTTAPADQGFARLALGHALTSRQRHGEALRAFQAAGRLFAETGLTTDRIRALILAAPQAAAGDQAPQAQELFAEAQRMAHWAGAHTLFEQARRLSRTIGPEPGAPEVSGCLTRLTLREREVALLAGEGLKTRDVAQRLRISPRTVDVHLTRIYAKLEVDSRAALARLIAGTVAFRPSA